MEFVARRINHVIRGLELPVSPLTPMGERLGLNQWPMTNDLINHAYVTKPPIKPKKLLDW